MRLLLIFLLGTLLSLTACKKGKAEITLKGTITDATFNTNLSGGTVELYEIEASTGDVNLLGSQQVSNGSYSFTFQRNAAESYLVKIKKNNYFEEDNYIPLSDLTIEEDNVHDYSVFAESWAGLHFVTTNPSSSLTYIRQAGKSGCEGCCPTSEQSIDGAIDTIIYCPNNGNTAYRYSYHANSFFGVKEVTTAAFDTTIVTLSY